MLNFFKIDNAKSRVFGLDLLRFFAIIFVLLGHSKLFLPEKYDHYVNRFLLDGVSIFFVLSGFLIGGILIKVLENKKPTFKNLLHFWKRRWMRTVPAYFVVLTFMVIYTFLLKPQRLADTFYLYYVFMQNMWTPQPAFFSESWSLSIEEWFYLLVPAFLFLGLWLTKWKVKYWFIIVVIVLISATILNRWHLYNTVEFTSHWSVYSEVFMRIFTRLDAIMCGVLGAFLAFYHPKSWNFAKYPLFIIGIYGLYWLKHHNQGATSEFNIIWIPTLKAIATLLLLPLLSKVKNGLGKATGFVTTISVISYSMYLLNLNVVGQIIIKYLFHGELLRRHTVGEYWMLDYAAYWFFTIVLSFALYKWVEIPFMKLRDRRIVE